jgi:hypothetical protein
MIARRTELAENGEQLERENMFVSRARVDAEAALVEAERRRHRGDATAADVAKAEKALRDLKMKAAQPWREKFAGIRAAVRDLDHEIAADVGQHYEELSAELGEDAQRAVAAMNDALAAVERAYVEREAVSGRVCALAGVIRRPRPNEIKPSRCDAAARECQRVLEQGGEVAPLPPEPVREPEELSA